MSVSGCGRDQGLTLPRGVQLLAHAWPLHQGAFPWHLTAGCVPVGYSHDGSFLYLAVPQAVMDGN